MPARSEAFHRPFPLSGGLMRVLGSIVEILPLSVGHRRHQLAVRDAVAGQLVGHQHTRHIPQALEQLAEEPFGGLGVSPRLHQHVQDVAVLVDRAPQVMGDPVDLHEQLIKVPLVTRARATSAQLVWRRPARTWHTSAGSSHNSARHHAPASALRPHESSAKTENTATRSNR